MVWLENTKMYPKPMSNSIKLDKDKHRKRVDEKVSRYDYLLTLFGCK